MTVSIRGAVAAHPLTITVTDGHARYLALFGGGQSKRHFGRRRRALSSSHCTMAQVEFSFDCGDCP